MSGDSNNGQQPADVTFGDRLYDTRELAARYRCSARTIRDWIEFGCPTPHGRVKLPASRMGRRYVVREEDRMLFEHRIRPRR
ncbi:DNA-binding protein [Rhodovulum sp. 12E13]|uniref:helix-turn-helix domain-containing protein n=1 Tax=Rhodovulum sp. 12E13 TaxID=2203891 RepID=UPI000E175250|nr:helix-turn-helix domain-containing protein [Rhodovulum sp. 12E13]RDC68046.1 DNA-binding protein [Rhodovulum sp. 12E13]